MVTGIATAALLVAAAAPVEIIVTGALGPRAAPVVNMALAGLGQRSSMVCWANGSALAALRGASS